jgi:hypothetical protein
MREYAARQDDAAWPQLQRGQSTSHRRSGRSCARWSARQSSSAGWAASQSVRARSAGICSSEVSPSRLSRRRSATSTISPAGRCRHRADHSVQRNRSRLAPRSKCEAGESDPLPPAHQDQHENDDRHDHPKLPITHFAVPDTPCWPAQAAHETL